MKELKHHLLLLALNVLLAAAVIAVVLFAYAGSQPLDADKLKVNLNNFYSSAASGQLLAEQAQNKKVTQTFFINECGLLQQNTQQTMQSLQKQQPGFSLQDAYAKTVNAGEKVSSELGVLCDSFGDAGKISKSQDSLKQAIDQINELQGKLAD